MIETIMLKMFNFIGLSVVAFCVIFVIWLLIVLLDIG